MFEGISNYIQRVRKNQQFSLVITMIAVFLFMTLMNGSRFLSYFNLVSMAYQLPVIGLLAIGMMIAILSGGINLSIIANANFSGIIIYLTLSVLTGGMIMEAGMFLIIIAMLAGFMVSVLIGTINGLLIAVLNIPALLATLGTMTLFQGLSLILTGGRTLSGFPSQLLFISSIDIIYSSLVLKYFI